MTWDRLLYFPIRKEGILKDFLTLIKNPKASAGFEPAILGTTVQHANHYATEAFHNKRLKIDFFYDLYLFIIIFSKLFS